MDRDNDLSMALSWPRRDTNHDVEIKKVSKSFYRFKYHESVCEMNGFIQLIFYASYIMIHNIWAAFKKPNKPWNNIQWNSWKYTTK